MTNSIENICDTHIETLIPWFITNQLRGEELAAVEQHIGSCEDCANIVQEERKIAALVQDKQVHVIPSKWSEFQQLISSDLDRNDSIELEESNDITPPPSNVIRFPLFNKAKTAISKPKTLGFIAVAQAAALVAVITGPNINTIGTVNEDNQIYGTLSSGEAPINQDANTLMQFDPSLTLKEFNTLLKSNDIEIISGPTPTNAYVVKISQDVTLESLRSHENILLAEPISAE